GELFERGNARLVGHEVFAVAHHADAERRALLGYRGAQDELERVVFKNLPLVARGPGLRIALREVGGEVGLLRVEGDESAAAPRHGADLAVDVSVVDADNGEAEARLLQRFRPPLLNVRRRGARRVVENGAGR